jgi:hypothetical protein
VYKDEGFLTALKSKDKKNRLAGELDSNIGVGHCRQSNRLGWMYQWGMVARQEADNRCAKWKAA